MSDRTNRATEEKLKYETSFETPIADTQPKCNSMAEEMVYQASRAAQIAAVQPTPEDIIRRYRQSKRWRLFPKEYMFHAMGDIRGKKILDFGCGEGELSTQLAKLGALVTGIDISPELIEIANKRAELDHVAENVQFHVADVLKSPPQPAHFDILICYAVLHHVDINQTFPILLHAVKPGGLVIIVEPIALSPNLQKLRDALPVNKDASPGEHQINPSELSFILRWVQPFQIKYFNLFTRLSRFLPHTETGDIVDRPAVKCVLLSLLWIDRLLIASLPFLQKYSGQVVIAGYKPS